MTRVRVVSHHTSLAVAVTRRLEASGLRGAVSHDHAERFTLEVRPSVDGERRAALLESLRPLTPVVESVEGADDGFDAVLHLGAEQGFDELQVSVTTDHEPLSEALAGEFAEHGFGVARTESHLVRTSRLRFGGASTFARQCLRFLLAERGIEVAEQREWSTDDMDVWLELRDPALAAVAHRQRFVVLLRTDDDDDAAPLAEELRAHGYRVELAPLEAPPEGQPQRFLIDHGPFATVGTADDLAILRSRVGAALAARGLDPSRHPIEETSTRAALRAVIDFPVGALVAGSLRPYGSLGGERFPLTVRTDVPDRAATLVERLERLGYRDVEVRPLDESFPVPRLTAGSLATASPTLFDATRQALEETVRELSSTEVVPVELRRFGEKDERVVLHLPVRALADGTARRAVESSLRRWNVVVHAHRRAAAPKALLADLREAGFRRVTSRPMPFGSEAAIKYGGAPDAVLQRIRDVLSRHTAQEFALENEWNEEDRDIFVLLPDDFGAESGTAGARTATAELPDLAVWIGGATHAETRAFLEPAASGCDRGGVADTLRVGSCRLPLRAGPRHPLVPSQDELRHFCIDGQTAETLLHLAEAVAMREPCLLEGETSTAKTSSVLYLAARLGQPVLRVNLHGQTDTGELVGRYVPDDRTEGGGWRWQEGAVLRALREGCWLLLDEVNLAEPQILERFNSLLEREPSLVVTEHDGERLAGDDIHPGFRLFATMNPAEYAGRSALSPAWRDRFRAHRVVPTPGEREIHQFLVAGVFGRPPEVTLSGAVWRGERGEAAWGSLAAVPGMDAFLRALARFHVSLERSLAASDAPGRHRRDRYVVTRRNLLSVLDWLVAHGGDEAAMRGGLVRYYVERLAAADRAHVVRLLDAAGIGPGSWSLGVGSDGAAAAEPIRRSA